MCISKRSQQWYTRDVTMVKGVKLRLDRVFSDELRLKAIPKIDLIRRRRTK